MGPLLLLAGAAAGYVGARRLMDDTSTIEALPAEVRGYAAAVRRRLLQARGLTRDLLSAIEEERAIAERELTDEFLLRAGRESSVAPESPLSRAR